MLYGRTNLLPVNDSLQAELAQKTERIQRNLGLVGQAMQLSESARFEESRHAYLVIAQRIFTGDLLRVPTLADFGYTSGEYGCSCSRCRRSFVGARDAVTCNICAERDLARSIVPSLVFPNE